jgi:prenyltransferase beta subunit
MPLACQKPVALSRLPSLAVVTMALAFLAAPALSMPVQSSQTADVVIDFGDGRAGVHRVAIDGTLTGLDLITSVPFPLEASGGAVCGIGGTGCPASECFCACDSADDCAFWGYFTGTAQGGWTFSETGAGERVLEPGSVDGWAWSGGTAPFTATVETRAALLGTRWLASAVDVDGAIAGHAGLTAELVLARLAAGERTTVDTAARFLARRAGTYAGEGAAQSGKLAVAVAAAGFDPRSFGGVDLVEAIDRRTNSATGRIGTTSWDQSWGILGLAAAGETVPAPIVTALVAMSSPAGGWGYAPSTTADADSTGLALQAMAAASANDNHPAVQAAFSYLASTQSDDGGWSHNGGGDSNTNSTAYVVQGLVAMRQDLKAQPWRDDGGNGPLDFLVGVQLPDGRFEYDTAPADIVSTLQAVPAVVRRSSIVAGPAVRARAAEEWVTEQRTDSGGFEGFNPGATIDAVLALDAVGADLHQPAPSGRTAAEYLREVAAEYAVSPAAAGKLTLAVVALGEDPAAFGGVDLPALINASVASDGAFGAGDTWSDSLAILGLTASGSIPPAEGIAHLLAGATASGGWGYEHTAAEPTADSTGLALLALSHAGVGPHHPTIRSGVSALRGLQLPDASFPGYGGGASVDSTALALRGLAAAGQTVTGPAWMRDTPTGARLDSLEALLGMQSPAGGFAGFSGPDDHGATYAALQSLGQFLPARTVPSPSIFLPAATKTG